MFGQSGSPFRCPECGAPTIRINEDHGREVAGCEACGRIHTTDPSEVARALDMTFDSERDDDS